MDSTRKQELRQAGFENMVCCAQIKFLQSSTGVSFFVNGLDGICYLQETVLLSTSRGDAPVQRHKSDQKGALLKRLEKEKWTGSEFYTGEEQ